ncbi:MAG: aldo/keto reductase [Nanoarchaeales archaeon]|nr:aldo/keto reductase [Nanoarchaeales archaeon]
MKTKSNKEISKLGIGTFGIGGKGHRDVAITERKDDNTYINAITHTLNHNINFTELCVGYGHGNSIKLFKKGLDKSNVKREDLFLTHALYTRDFNSIEDIKKDIETFHKVMNTDYSDSTLVTQSLLIRFGEEKIYEILDELLKNKKTNYVSLSNASPTWIKRFHNKYKDNFFAHEGHISYEMRALQDKGIFELCDKLKVRNIIWRPFRRNQTNKKNWTQLTELSKKYNKTQNQIILNWLIHENFYPMVFSANPKHIDENIESMNFKMEQIEYNLLTQFRPDNNEYKNIDWEGLNIDNDIVNEINKF